MYAIFLRKKTFNSLAAGIHLQANLHKRPFLHNGHFSTMMSGLCKSMSAWNSAFLVGLFMPLQF